MRNLAIRVQISCMQVQNKDASSERERFKGSSIMRVQPGRSSARAWFLGERHRCISLIGSVGLGVESMVLRGRLDRELISWFGESGVISMFCIFFNSSKHSS